jgi:transcriptional regulator with XRE-family HTH domain
MDSNYKRSLARLRALRVAAGLTLRQVEIKSRGKWKAVVVGSYERGTRHLSLMRAVELCEFYGADLAELGTAYSETESSRIILDLKRLARARNLPDDLSRTISRLAGRITSLRKQDLDNLQFLTDMSRSELIGALRLRELLLLGNRQN